MILLLSIYKQLTSSPHAGLLNMLANLYAILISNVEGKASGKKYPPKPAFLVRPYFFICHTVSLLL